MSKLQIVSNLCQENALSPAELAERAGLDPECVMAIVMGRRTPSPEERMAVAGVFGLAPDQIMWGHKTPIQHIYGL